MSLKRDYVITVGKEVEVRLDTAEDQVNDVVESAQRAASEVAGATLGSAAEAAGPGTPPSSGPSGQPAPDDGGGGPGSAEKRSSPRSNTQGSITGGVSLGGPAPGPDFLPESREKNRRSQVRQREKAARRERLRRKRVTLTQARKHLGKIATAARSLKSTPAMKWCPARVSEVLRLVQAANHILSRQDMAEFNRTMGALTRALTQVKSETVAAERAAAVRKHVVKRFLATMHKAGMADVECRLADPADPSSAVLLSGFRRSGSPVAGTVSLSGEARFDFGRGRATTAECERAVRKFEEVLKSEGGVKLRLVGSTSNPPLGPVSAARRPGTAGHTGEATS